MKHACLFNVSVLQISLVGFFKKKKKYSARLPNFSLTLVGIMEIYLA
jgi:hypothetical protein